MTREEAISEPIVEHAQEYTDGSMLVWSNDLEAVYPTERRIEDCQRFGGKVYRRRVIVVSDWELVPK